MAVQQGHVVGGNTLKGVSGDGVGKEWGDAKACCVEAHL